MRVYEFIENLEDDLIEEFLDQLDDFKEDLRFNYDLVKNQLDDNSDKQCLQTMVNIYNGSIKNGYNGFIWNEDIDKFYEDNSEYLNQYLIDYLECSGLSSLEDLCGIISKDMSVELFLDDITLRNSDKVKRNIVCFFAEDIIYEVISNFYEFFDERLKDME